MIIIVIGLLLLAGFVLVTLSNQPGSCVGHATGCAATLVFGNGVMIDANVVHFALFVLLVGAMYQMYKSR